MGLIITIFVLACMIALKLTNCLSESVFIFILLVISGIGLVFFIDRISRDKSRMAIACLILDIVVFTLLVIILLAWPMQIGEKGACMINKAAEYLKVAILGA